MGKAVVFIREGMDACGADEQERAVRRYCEGHGVEVEDVVRGDMEVWNGLVFGDGLYGKEAEMVIVARNDAVSADVIGYYAYKGILKRMRIELVSVVENPGGYRLYAKLLDGLIDEICLLERVNAYRKPNTAYSMIDGKSRKASRGGYSGGQPPMGYRAVNGKLEVNEKEAEAVRFIFKRKHDGKTMMGTVDALNEGGYKTRRGKKFQISSVQSIWNNERFYRGWYRYGKDSEWVRGQHEPILTDEE